jgi:glycerol-3-phosphate dehydrogenase
VDDVLVRRLHLYHETRDQGMSAAHRVAALLAQELGWDEAWATAAAERYIGWVTAERAALGLGKT